MPDTLGPVTIADPPHLGAWPSTLPCPEMGASKLQAPDIITHAMQSSGGKLEQRFYRGARTPVYQFDLILTRSQFATLRDFWESTDGGVGTFDYTWTNQDTTTTTLRCRFAMDRLSRTPQGAMYGCRVALQVVPVTAPSYSISSTLDRFPSGGLATALLAEVQEIIPLLVVEASDGTKVYLSNQRVTIGGQLYLPRLIDWQGISQQIDGNSDQAAFVLGNADGAFTSFVNAVDVYRARVSFSLFHVGSAIKLDLWSGNCAKDPPFSLDSGPRFNLYATDGLYELKLTYPRRKISETCWKVYKGIHCRATSANTTCAKTWEACQANTNTLRFGGLRTLTQIVTTKDNSTGMWGYGRSKIQSASVSSESPYDKVLPEVWSDLPVTVPVHVAVGRDEGDFYSAAGPVCEGPIQGYSANLNDHRLDGAGPHDPLKGGGWRGLVGNEPAQTSDYIGLSQAPWSGPTAFPNSTYAASIAWAEIRRTDSKGVTVQKTQDRQMSVVVSGGLGGWVWTAPNARTWRTALANPAWLMINWFLRGLGLFANPENASEIPASVMEKYFDVDAAIAAAAICDQVVPAMFGGGTEKQFVFSGVLRDNKPLRDWLNELGVTFLGYWTMRNGKIRVGCRINAASVDAYGNGNILLDSLKVDGIAPEYNWIQINYGEPAQSGRSASIPWYDEDHAKRAGLEDQPLYFQGSKSLPGVQGKSQAARLATVLIREQLGGVGSTEQRLARRIDFDSTVLAAGAEPGQVVSVSDPAIPGGFAKFRIVRTVFNSDFSISISAKPVTDAMYDVLTGPRPQDVPAAVPVSEYNDAPSYLIYCADQEAPETGDPMYATSERSVSIEQTYEPTLDGVRARLVIRGKAPINILAAAEKPPKIRTVTWSPSGGGLFADRGYSFSVCPVASDGSIGPSSNRVQVFVAPGINTASVTLSDITWPTGAWVGYLVHGGDDTSSYCRQADGSGLPSSITITGLLRHTQQFPASTNKFVRVKAKAVPHAGVIGTSVTSVPASNQIICSELVDVDSPIDNWVGGTVSWLLDVSDLSTPLRNYTVTAFDAATGRLTFDRDVVISGQPENSMDSLDVIVIRIRPSAASPDTISDPRFQNRVAPDGLNPADEIGRVVRIIAGKGRGQFRAIVAATATSVTVDPPFDGGIDSTSVPVIEEANWNYEADSSPLPADRGDRVIEIPLNIDNVRSQVYGVMAFLVDAAGTESLEEYSFYRDVFALAAPAGLVIIQEEESSLYSDVFANRFGPNVYLEKFSRTDGVKKISAVVSGGARVWESDGPGGGGSGATVHTLTLTAASTEITRAVGAAGSLLIVRLIQDATGDRLITWKATEFAADSSTEIQTAPTKETRFTFCALGGLWRQVGAPHMEEG